MKKILFIDRDGTIIREPLDRQVDSLEKLSFVPGAITNLARIAVETGHVLVMVTNQDGLGTDAFPESDFLPPHRLMLETLAGEGVEFADVFIDSSLPEENLPTRKPGTAMLRRYLAGDFDIANSFVIGDRPTDVQLAANLGSRAIYLRNPDFPLDDIDGRGVYVVDSWAEILSLISATPRKVSRKRKTIETDIEVELDLDGSGSADIDTGIKFFDHMLEQVARHGGFDLMIKAAGDLDVDEHHTIEDVAITLGEAVNEALGDKRGIERYGFCLPMDDCLAQVAVDLGGRNWIVWDAEFRREMIGQMPTEMFFHFFKSFSDHARCNLNIRADGTIEHHKIEAIFKAFARALRMAADRKGGILPTTKGVL